MDLPGLITVRSEDEDLLDRLAHMMGTAFLEEYWTREWLSALDDLGTSPDRKCAIAQAMLGYNLKMGAPYHCAYALPDLSGGAGGYLASELQGHRWNDLEDKATALMMEEVLDQGEQEALAAKAEAMEPITDFSWMYRHTRGQDFIHWFALGVDRASRGSGAFRRLFTPFLDFADAQGLNCYLECYSDRTEAVYAHFGFQTIEERSSPAFSLVERCMLRKPTS
ncbi:MAG: hypothetical protein LBG81_05520 [Coriobacteriaceae bacterium]|jgi:GNAT superfamily N-acetyltransferase|nr:hypothetical protein [Coriobacteriaceae bacterium]